MDPLIFPPMSHFFVFPPYFLGHVLDMQAFYWFCSFTIMYQKFWFSECLFLFIKKRSFSSRSEVISDSISGFPLCSLILWVSSVTLRLCFSRKWVSFPHSGEGGAAELMQTLLSLPGTTRAVPPGRSDAPGRDRCHLRGGMGQGRKRLKPQYSARKHALNLHSAITYFPKTPPKLPYPFCGCGRREEVAGCPSCPVWIFERSPWWLCRPGSF